MPLRTDPKAEARRRAFPTHPVGTRVEHYWSHDLATVRGHDGDDYVLELDSQPGFYHVSHPINWYPVNE